MSSFDPYHKWLAIPPKDQPPNHYRLLAVDLFEFDPDVVASAADQRMSHVRSFQTGQNSAISQRILNEIAAAKLCLLNPQKKAEYDRRLREQFDAGASARPEAEASREWDEPTPDSRPKPASSPKSDSRPTPPAASAGPRVADEESKTAAKPEKRDIPDSAAQKKALATIRDVYKDDYETVSGRAALAGKLIQDAKGTEDDPVARFVLLQQAKEIASETGQIELAFQAVDDLANEYALSGPGGPGRLPARGSHRPERA